MVNQRRVGAIGFGAIAICLSVNCADTSLAPQPKAVFAVFDPAAMPPVIPLPNELVNLPATPATSALATFSGAIDPGTVTAKSVFVVDATAMVPLLSAGTSFDPATFQLTIRPPMGGWPAGHRIAIALRGSPGGLVGMDGVPVVAGPTFYFARSLSPLSNCAMAAPGCTSATPVIPVAEAVQLEQLRQALSPLLSALVGLGIPRGELALVWTFFVTGGASQGDGGALTDGGATKDGSIATDGGALRDGGK